MTLFYVFVLRKKKTLTLAIPVRLIGTEKAAATRACAQRQAPQTNASLSTPFLFPGPRSKSFASVTSTWHGASVTLRAVWEAGSPPHREEGAGGRARGGRGDISGDGVPPGYRDTLPYSCRSRHKRFLLVPGTCCKEDAPSLGGLGVSQRVVRPRTLPGRRDPLLQCACAHARVRVLSAGFSAR